MKTYTTKEVATRFGIHSNTVRFYDDQGYLSPVERTPRGYRIFTDLHLEQIRILRCLFFGDWPGKNIRTASLLLVAKLKEWDREALEKELKEYLGVIEGEMAKAREAMELLAGGDGPQGVSVKDLTAAEASAIVGVTRGTLRNWERNNLLQVPRSRPHGKRFFTSGELRKLKVIYFLRTAGYSIAAIHVYLNHPESAVLIEAYTTGDHLLEVFETALKKGREIGKILQKIDPPIAHHPPHGVIPSRE